MRLRSIQGKRRVAAARVVHEAAVRSGLESGMMLRSFRE